MSDPKWEMEFLEEHGVVHLTATGRMGLEEILEWSAEVFELASIKSSSVLLHDLRGMTPVMSAADIYRLPEALGELGLTHRMRVAIAVTRLSGKSSDFDFFETVARNSGFRVKLFLSRNEAWDWLVSEE